MKSRKITRKNMIRMLSVSASGLLYSNALISSPKIEDHNWLAENDPSLFNQDPLKYSYNALEPIIDAVTMEIHYSKHAAGYCANLNRALQENNIDISKGLEGILSSISAYPTSVRNNGGGHYNHELFWKCMKPGGKVLNDNKLSQSILHAFGSYEAFQKLFSDVALSRFGSGWAWLIVNSDNSLSVVSTPNQDNPLMDISAMRGYPLLGLDVWEHAYYLKYQNRRAEYMANWWRVVDWDFVSRRHEQLLGRF
jgi:Fe-Mn family superoxide dismutase